jgi:aminobenzoyl-glutamate utilization protein B
MKMIAKVAQRFVALTVTLLPAQAFAQQATPHRQLIEFVDRQATHFSATSKTIWDYAELGYQEEKSSALLQRELQAAGFRVQSGVAGEPTAFVASYGQGQPVIGILGEFDALPGLSQDATPIRKPILAEAPGHACGHNLLGSGAALAAVALREYMERNQIAGTLRYYGTPAEEGGDGKVYMLRAGLFRDVDAILHWHPGDQNSVFNGGMLAINSARFQFHGVAAHAAAAPDRGRSALDAVMLMGNGIEFLREHIPSNSRIHYVISNGGAAPNVVPDIAEMYLYARNPSSAVLNNVWSRILKVGQGAALMTETTMEVKDIGGDTNVVANDVLAKLAQGNLEEIGGFRYTPEERQFAEELQRSLPPDEAGKLDSTTMVLPLGARPGQASTDAGDVSWNVPTIGFRAATFVPGVVAHTWQAAATSGMSIGQKGMVVAAKALAITGADLFADAKLIADAKAEFRRQLNGNAYQSVIPESQKPPLGYRNQ